MSYFNYNNIILSKDFNKFTEEQQNNISLASENLYELNTRFESNNKVFYDGEYINAVDNSYYSEHFAEILANIIRFESKDNYTEKEFLKTHKINISEEFNYLKNKIENHRNLSLNEKENYLNPRLIKFFRTYRDYCPITNSLTESVMEDYLTISQYYTNELNVVQNKHKIDF